MINKDFKISKNKSIDLGWFYNMATKLVRFEIDVRQKTDQNGFQISIGGLFLFYAHFELYDKRHWNDDKNRYYLEGEENWSN